MELIGTVLAILGGIYALEARELMRGVLGLSVFFLGISVLFGAMGAWFLAIGQIFLFVGGVVTLFVLAFSYTKTPVQKANYGIAALVAVVVAFVLYRYLNVNLPIQPATMQEFASMFFGKYGFVLNVALLVLFSAVMTAQYVMTEDAQ